MSNARGASGDRGESALMKLRSPFTLERLKSFSTTTDQYKARQTRRVVSGACSSAG